MIVSWEMIIRPLPIFARIAKVNTNGGELKVNKKTSGKHTIRRIAPVMYTSIYKLIPSSHREIHVLLETSFFYSSKLLFFFTEPLELRSYFSQNKPTK